jgi:hypothetical protein
VHGYRTIEAISNSTILFCAILSYHFYRFWQKNNPTKNSNLTQGIGLKANLVND